MTHPHNASTTKPPSQTSSTSSRTLSLSPTLSPSLSSSSTSSRTLSLPTPPSPSHSASPSASSHTLARSDFGVNSPSTPSSQASSQTLCRSDSECPNSSLIALSRRLGRPSTSSEIEADAEHKRGNVNRDDEGTVEDGGLEVSSFAWDPLRRAKKELEAKGLPGEEYGMNDGDDEDEESDYDDDDDDGDLFRKSYMEGNRYYK